MTQMWWRQQRIVRRISSIIFQRPIILDEIQRCPGNFVGNQNGGGQRPEGRTIYIDGLGKCFNFAESFRITCRKNGGSAVRPLSQGEILGVKETFIDLLFADEFNLPTNFPNEDRNKLFTKMLIGGYPEVISRTSQPRRQDWFRNYINTILQRDIRDLANIEGLVDLPRLLELLAARAGGILNYAEVSRSIGFPQMTLKRYMTLLETTFLIETVPAWSGSIKKRLIKAPKLFIGDTGLLSYSVGLKSRTIAI